MITQNVYNAFMAGAFNKTGLKFKTYNGSEYTAYNYGANGGVFSYFNNMASAATSASGYGIHLGTSNESASLDDYYLKGTFLDSSYSKSIKYTKTEDETGVTHQSIITIVNNSTEEISIGEVGYMSHIYYSSNGNIQYALFDRTALDEPLVIPAGDTGQITYTIRIDFPA